MKISSMFGIASIVTIVIAANMLCLHIGLVGILLAAGLDTFVIGFILAEVGK